MSTKGSQLFQRTAAAILGCGLFCATAQAQLAFQSHQVLQSQTQPQSTSSLETRVTGDFNNDGRQDLIVRAYPSQSGMLYLSNADGTYQGPYALPVSGIVAVGDFNHDGKLDVAGYTSPNSSPQSIVVSLGNGDGTFQAPKVIAGSAVEFQLAIVAADMNHDSKTDLVQLQSGTLTIWQSNGDGTFTKGQTVTTYNPPSSGNQDGALLGDFDGDGNPDIAVTYSAEGPTRVQVWYGDGAGHIGSAVVAADPNGYEDSLAVADLNNDGHSDLVGSAFIYGASGTSQSVPKISIFTGNANRTLTYSALTTDQCPYSVGVADFNGDGLNDLSYMEGSCTTGDTGVTLVVKPGTGGGAFGAAQTIAQAPYTASGLQVLRSTVGTKPDLLYVATTAPYDGYGNGAAAQLVLLTNDSTGSFPGCGLSGMAEGISICTPPATADSPVKFSIGAAGPTPMRTAAVWVDGKKVAEQLTHAFSNYSFLDASVPLTAGTHAVTLYGTGVDNTLQQKSFTLTVGAGSTSGCSAPSSPSVHICSPTNYSTVNSPVNVTATATITGTLARMEIWVDGVKKYTETTSTSLNQSLALAPGSHVIDIYAANTGGGLWKSTANVTVNGVACAAPSSPGVNVCAPTSGSTVHSPATVTASATIAGALARMEVWVDGSKKFTETTSTTLSTGVPLSTGYHRFDIYAVNTAGTKYEATVYATVQ